MPSRLRATIRHRLQPAPPERSLPAISRWFTAPVGRAMLVREQRDIDELLPNLFGYHLCQLSVSPHLDLTAASRISHTFGLSPCAEPGVAVQARSDYRRLPLAPESVDVILLHHALDFSQTPHQLLAEASRALIPRGFLVIVGFNPRSLLGFWHGCLRWSLGSLQWRRQSLSQRRLRDWLALLDLELVEARQGFHLPVKRETTGPFERWLHRLRSPGGGYYILLVRKDVCATIPLKPQWRTPKLDAIGGGRLSGGSRAGNNHSEKHFKKEP